MSERMADGGRSFIDAGGVVLHAERRGRLEAPVIVFANSLGTDARIWQEVLAKLPDHYGTVTYDKRGHGLSDSHGDPSSIADHARDLLGLLDHFGIGRFALVGLSVGGMRGLSSNGTENLHKVCLPMTAMGGKRLSPAIGCAVRFAIQNRTCASDLCNDYAADFVGADRPCLNLDLRSYRSAGDRRCQGAKSIAPEPVKGG